MSTTTEAPARAAVVPAAPAAAGVGPVPVSGLRRAWRIFKGLFVVLVVVFHLVVLAVRNPLDLWEDALEKWMKEHPAHFKLTDESLASLRADKVPAAVLDRLEAVKDRDLDQSQFAKACAAALDEDEWDNHHKLILDHARVRFKLTDKALAALRTDKVPDDVLLKLQSVRDRELNEPEFKAACAAALDSKEWAKHQELILYHAKWNYWARYGDKVYRADDFTYRFTNLVGIEQRWVMFGAPLSRDVDFLTVRLEFTDASQEVLLSANEPNPTRYFRFGGWQVRKLEDYLLGVPRNMDTDPRKPQWEGYARYKHHQWRELRPGDPRQLSQIVFVRRRIYLPEPNQDFADVAPPREWDLVVFDAKGKFVRVP
jgi:hypothetical protein